MSFSSRPRALQQILVASVVLIIALPRPSGTEEPSNQPQSSPLDSLKDHDGQEPFIEPQSSPPDSLQSQDGLKEQFTINLPDGWSTYDQTEAVTGKPNSLGVVVFSSQPVIESGENTADLEVLKRVDTGEIPSFVVDRIPADKGMSCSKFSKTSAYNLGVGLAKDPMFGAVRQLFSATPVKHEKIQIGGCQGFRYKGSAKRGKWILDVRAVSDGKVLYLFMLRNQSDNYTRNLPIFDEAIASIQLTQLQ